jgi:hypothetical protein
MSIVRRLVLAQLIVLVALALSPALEAHAIVLCRKKARIQVRDGACRRKETQVTLTDLGLPPPADVFTKAESDARYATQAALAALTGGNIVDRSLTLADLGTNGGPFGGDQTETVTSPIALPAGSCQAALTANFGEGVEGNMVIGTLTDQVGQAVLPNTAAVVPSIVIKTTQGGAVPNVIVCNTGTAPLTIPAGSVFHWRMISAH